MPNTEISAKPTKVEIQIPDPTWQNRINIPNVFLETDQPTYGEEPVLGDYYVQGNVTNQSLYELNTVLVKAILFI